MINDINNLAANAYQYYIRPQSMGGGGGTISGFTGWTIPVKMSSNENGTYSISTAGSTAGVGLQGKSGQNSANTVTASINSDGRVTTMTFGGEFQ